MTSDELPADMEDLKKWADGHALMKTDRLAESVRDLLKAYQEQERVFRALFESISYVRCNDGTRSYGFSSFFWAAYREAEAALNQKCDER